MNSSPPPPPPASPPPPPPPDGGDRIRIGIVPYLNMLPLVSGMENLRLDSRPGLRIEPVGLPPSLMASAMDRGELELGMVPVGALADRPGWRVVGDSAIISRGPVRSVLLLGRSHPAGWRRLHPDSHSRTSNVLARILLDEFYGVRPADAEPVPLKGWSPPADAAHDEAFVLIGTRALTWREGGAMPDAHVEDLGALWGELTGLPFVYAVWAMPSAGTLAPDVLAELTAALEGLKRENQARLAERIAAWPGLAEERLTPGEALEYLTENILFDMDEDCRRGMALYQEKGRALGLFAPRTDGGRG